LGVNRASAATKLTEAGTTYWGAGSKMMRASLPSSVWWRRLSANRLSCTLLEDQEFAEHFHPPQSLRRCARIGVASRRHQNQIVQNSLKTLDLSLRTLDCSVGLVALCCCPLDERKAVALGSTPANRLSFVRPSYDTSKNIELGSSRYIIPTLWRSRYSVMRVG
jgi:hypothetical protein